MARVRVLVGTRKGAFVLTADGARRDWRVEGPHFPGWEVYHVAGSPADPDRLWAAPSGGWFGQVVQRSDDGGGTWEPVGNDFSYVGDPGTHQWYDGTLRPWEFTRVWHLEPSRTDPDTVWAGVAGRRRCSAAPTAAAPGRSCPACARRTPVRTGSRAPAGCACTPCSCTPPTSSGCGRRSRRPGRSAPTTARGPGTRSTKGCTPRGCPTRTPRSGTACTSSRCTPTGRRCCSCRSTGTCCAATTRGDSWREISGDLPSDFGFPVAVHAHEPDTVYVVPITSDSQHFPPDGRLRVYRSRVGGDEWEPLTEGLPQEHCYVDVLRDAMAVDALDECGLYVGTTGGQVYASADAGDSWDAVARDLPPVLSVEVQTLP